MTSKLMKLVSSFLHLPMDITKDLMDILFMTLWSSHQSKSLTVFYREYSLNIYVYYQTPKGKIMSLDSIVQLSISVENPIIDVASFGTPMIMSSEANGKFSGRVKEYATAGELL